MSVAPPDTIDTNEQGGKQTKSFFKSELLDPVFLLQVSNVLKEGAEKYGRDNWHNIPVDNHLGRALTHLLLWLAGDRSENHFANAACRIMFAAWLDRNKAKEPTEKPAVYPRVVT